MSKERDIINQLYACWSSQFPDGTKTPASKKEIEKSRPFLDQLLSADVEDEELKAEIDSIKERFDIFYIRKFDGINRAMIGSGIVSLYILFNITKITSQYGFFSSATLIYLGIVLLWGIGGTVGYYYANIAPQFLIDDLLADRLAGNKIAQMLGISLDSVAANIKPTTVKTHYSDGSTTTHTDYNNSNTAGLFVISFKIVSTYIIPVVTAPFMALKKYLHNYVLYKNQKDGGVIGAYLRFIGAM